MTRLYLSSLLLVGACAADPVSYSAPVGIEMKIKSSDVTQSIVTERKDITTEVGNPYGAFTNDAIAQLGGKQPSRIELDELTLSLGAQSTGVSALEQVMTGDIDVALLVNNSSNTYDAGHVTNPTGIGPVAMDATFDWSTVAPLDRTEIINGSFKVVLRGPAAPGFSALDANAVLQTTFTFTAFQ
ncbi:MAG TPA: hypothetical protein VLB44_27670 [Kofleriaceae bacterium]|nr:hypothetical protein [Kofleriaceae bacterium]